MTCIFRNTDVESVTMTKRATRIILLATCGLAQANAGSGPEIPWFSIDGGGETFSAGGDFELGGTIGQPDAGATLSGGGLQLTGGLWAPIASLSVGLCPGDLNCDGVVDFDDIDPFVAALGCQGGDPNCWDPACPWRNGDCNGDQTVNFDDIDPFVARIGATCP